MSDVAGLITSIFDIHRDDDVNSCPANLTIVVNM